MGVTCSVMMLGTFCTSTDASGGPGYGAPSGNGLATSPSTPQCVDGTPSNELCNLTPNVADPPPIGAAQLAPTSLAEFGDLGIPNPPIGQPNCLRFQETKNRLASFVYDRFPNGHLDVPLRPRSKAGAVFFGAKKDPGPPEPGLSGAADRPRAQGERRCNRRLTECT